MNAQKNTQNTDNQSVTEFISSKKNTQNTDNQSVKVNCMNIREQLLKGNVEFTVKGITTYRAGDDGKYGINTKIFEVNKNSDAINSEFRGMNVTKWGTTCVTLYTFDMLGKKTVGKIHYKLITIIKK